MRGMFACVLGCLLVSAGYAADAKPKSSGMQTVLDAQKKLIAGWAADPVIVAAVKEQNKKGPIPGMDNEKWKDTKKTDSVVKGFETSPAGALLAKKVKDSKGLFTEAFLSAAKGEKVAFVDKPTSYIHAGNPKFDDPMNNGKPWQGKPELDESTQTKQVQIAAPVTDKGKTIGVLVVGVSWKKLEGK